MTWSPRRTVQSSSQPQKCHLRRTFRANGSSASKPASRAETELSLSNGPVAAFAGFLSQQLGHQVNDKTGLAGSYDITLRWNPTSDATESISEALQTQLGLKLEPQQGSVRVLTIDQAEEPAED